MGEERLVIVLYDDHRARQFEPFATSRPLGEMRAGALLVRERWAHILGETPGAFIAATALDAFAEFDAPPSTTQLSVDPLPAGTIVVNTRALPFMLHEDSRNRLDAVGRWLVGAEVAAVRLRHATPCAHFRDGTMSLDALDADGAGLQLDGHWLADVWDIVAHLPSLLAADIPVLANMHQCTAMELDSQASRAVIIGAHPVWIEAGAIVEPHTVFDTSLGPVLLRRGAIVQAFTRVVGPCFIGINSVVMADRIAGSAIGDMCRVHGELSACVFIGYANKGHDGFVGHSIVGRWVNLGAGTITSNLKNTYGSVALWTPAGVRDTGMQFLGTLFGDHAKTGIGLRLTTGCVLGAGANVMNAMPPKVVAPFAWGTSPPYAAFNVEKFIETAARMMSRRNVSLDAAQQDFWRATHARAIADERWSTT